MKTFLALPQSETCRLIDFEKAVIHDLSIHFKRILEVSGSKPYCNMTVTLNPRIYIDTPDYWGIEVVGCLPGVGLPQVAPYSVGLPIDAFIGKKGIEVIGATSSKKIDLQ